MDICLEVSNAINSRLERNYVASKVTLRLNAAPARCLQIQRSLPTIPYLKEFGRQPTEGVLGGLAAGNMHQAYVTHTTAIFDDLNKRAIGRIVLASAAAAACSLGASLLLPYRAALPIVVLLCGALLAFGLREMFATGDALRDMRTAQVGMRLHDRYQDLMLEPCERDLLAEQLEIIKLSQHAQVAGLYDRRLEPLFDEYLELVNSHFA